MLNEILLGDIAQIKLGVAFKSAIKDAGNMGRCYLIQTKDITPDDSINYEVLSKVIPEVNADAHILKDRDIVLRLRGPIFSASIIDKVTDLPIITTNQTAVIRCNPEKISPYYLSWFLNSPSGQRYFDGVSEGTNINKISAKIVSAISLNLPSMEDQLKIGNLYKNWLDQKRVYRKLIDNGNQLINTLCSTLQNR